MVDDTGKESNYNEASFQMQRIHHLREIIADLMVNLRYYDPILRKYNYETVIPILINLSQEIKGKFSDEQKEIVNRYRKVLYDLLEFCPPYKQIIQNTLSGNSSKPFFIRENFVKLRTQIFDFSDFLVDMIEEHDYGAPNKEEALWD